MNRIFLCLVALGAFLSPVRADEKSDWDLLERKSAPPVQRKSAAKNAGTCEKAVNGMIPIALDPETYPEVKLGIVEAIAACDCDGVRKSIAKKIGQGKADERAWILQVARAIAAPEIDKAVLEKGLTDDKIENRVDAVAILTQHRSPAAAPAFEALLKAKKSRTRQALGAIVAQLANEPKGTRLNAECVSALMRSTGMNFADRAADWAAWWQKNVATFEFPKASTAPTTGAPRTRESETKVVQFYGIEVESKRVCFVVDISGSMKEEMKEGDNQGTSRLEVAKRELGKIIDGLEPGTLFNIVTFSSDVEAWLDQVGDLPVGLGGKKPEGDKRLPATGGVGTPADKEKDEKQKLKDAEAQTKLDEQLRAKAHKYVDKLEAEGGTNIHDALERAFEDKQLDTIFFLTDGEPSFGREVDPVRIREIVQRWNVSRRIKICAISIGTDMDLLKNLAADSGGEYRFFK